MESALEGSNSNTAADGFFGAGTNAAAPLWTDTMAEEGTFGCKLCGSETPETKFCVLGCITAPMLDAFTRERLAESMNIDSADTKTGGGALWRMWPESTVPLGKLKIFPGEAIPNGDTAETCSCDDML